MSNDQPDPCVFCDRVGHREYDHANAWAVAFQPLNPVTPGHFLVIPRAHVVSALESPNEAARAMHLAAELAANMGMDAANFITSAGSAATQTVGHLHIHVIPRAWNDGLALPWTGQQQLEDRLAAV